MNVAVDAAVCLLLITAAVVGLVTVDRSPAATHGAADAVADSLATTTGHVNYSLAPGVREMRTSTPTTDGVPAVALDSPELHRTAHGSLAGLLARGAMAGSGVDLDRERGRGSTADLSPLTRSRVQFGTAVSDAVRARTGASVRIDAMWRPYPGAPVGGHLGVGPEPSSGRVHAATLRIPTGVEPPALPAADGFDRLGTIVAERTVTVLVPPGPARLTLRGDDPAAALVRHRYARLATATDASVAAPLATEDTAAANARIARRLAPRMTADLRSQYESPEEAASAVSVSSVRIVVRTWDDAGGER
ncbi:MAG: hypothetical protein ABEI27_11395 [Halobellus sp.]|uniref:DUF7284 family protein n=1 Tax=Halobellus sp. TaxID=1979212 RepID=UPI0035D3D95F